MKESFLHNPEYLIINKPIEPLEVGVNYKDYLLSDVLATYNCKIHYLDYCGAQNVGYLLFVEREPWTKKIEIFFIDDYHPKYDQDVYYEGKFKDAILRYYDGEEIPKAVEMIPK